MKKDLYFDHSSSSFPSKKVLEVFLKGLEEQWASPLSPCKKGQAALRKIRESYESIYHLLDTEGEYDLVLTSSGTEAVNHALYAASKTALEEEGRNHFLTTKIEEAPNILGLERLARESGAVVTQLDVNSNGQLEAATLKGELTPRTGFLSFSLVNGVTGVLQPIDEILEVARERGLSTHVDVTHAVGKFPMSLAEWGVDYCTFDGQALHCPQGIGVLLYRKNHPLPPFIVGGAEQRGRRGGSWSAAHAMALGQAAMEGAEYLDYMGTEISMLRFAFEQAVTHEIPGIEVAFAACARAPHLSTLLFPGVANDLLLYRLNERGVTASFGGGNFQQISLLLEASNYPKEKAKTALSFSFCRWHDQKHIDDLVQILKEEVLELQKASKHWSENECVSP